MIPSGYPYVSKIRGIPAELPADLQRLFDASKEYFQVPNIIWDTLEIPDPLDVEPTDPIYPPTLRLHKFFMQPLGSYTETPRRQKEFFDANFTKSAEMSLSKCMRINEIRTRIIPRDPALSLHDRRSLYWWAQSIMIMRVQQNDRFMFRMSDALTAGNPHIIAGVYHDPDDSMLFDFAGDDVRAHGLAGYPANGLILKDPLYLRPAIEFYLEMQMCPNARWRSSAFYPPLSETPKWCPARLEVELVGTAWIPATEI